MKNVLTNMMRNLRGEQSTPSKEKMVIGQVETIRFPTLGDHTLDARVDTGAKTSSLWASDCKETPKGLEVRIASPDHGINQHTVTFDQYSRVRVASSMGHKQVRYKVKLPIVIRNRRIMATFTLSDRSTQAYPVLIGRSTLHGKFIVDVTGGVAKRGTKRRTHIQSQQTIVKERV